MTEQLIPNAKFDDILELENAIKRAMVSRHTGQGQATVSTAEQTYNYLRGELAFALSKLSDEELAAFRTYRKLVS